MLTMGVKFDGIHCGLEVLEAVVYIILQPSEKKKFLSKRLKTLTINSTIQLGRFESLNSGT